MADNTSRILRLVAALALMAFAANCFLKYLWWTACYSAWNGIPKLAEQWRAAGANASFNGWILIVLDATSVAVFFSLITLRSTSLSGFFKNGVRLAASLTTTILGTALLAWALSWLKQGIH
jgi:hypothetical protein